LIKFYTDVADASPIPVLLYSNPSSTKFEISAAVPIVLAKHENIVGIKDSTGNVSHQVDYIIIAAKTIDLPTEG
jgi:4-hydroxy-2-oxoglutarate aldolase